MPQGGSRLSDPPDLVVVDIRMPPANTFEGIDVARAIRSEFPQIGILLLSGHVEVETAIDFLRSGDSIGYLLKSRILKVDALERIALGSAVIDPVLVQELLGQQRRIDPLAVLTAREREVLSLVAEGCTRGRMAWTGACPSKSIRAWASSARPRPPRLTAAVGPHILGRRSGRLPGSGAGRR
jgi:DNA-binding NarL/FixJ family response regulator